MAVSKNSRSRGKTTTSKKSSTNPSNPNDEPTNDASIAYALAKQIPAMRDGCTIETNCGSLELLMAVENRAYMANSDLGDCGSHPNCDSCKLQARGNLMATKTCVAVQGSRRSPELAREAP